MFCRGVASLFCGSSFGLFLFILMSDNGVLPELAEVDEGGNLDERFARLEQLVSSLAAEVGRLTRVSSGPSPAGGGKFGSGGRCGAGLVVGMSLLSPRDDAVGG